MTSELLNHQPKSFENDLAIDIQQVQLTEYINKATECFKSGQTAQAYDLLSTHKSIFEESLIPENTINYNILLGKILREQGKPNEAQECFTLAYQLSKQYYLATLEGDSLNQLASIANHNGDIAKALIFLEKASFIYESLGLKQKQADVLNNTGILYRSLSEYETSLVKLQEAYELLKDIAPISRSAAINLIELGLTYVSLKNFDRIENLYKDALDISIAIEDKLIEVVIYLNLGEFYLELNNLSEVETAYQKARELSISHGFKIYEIHALEGLGNLYLKKAFFTKAKDTNEQVNVLATQVSDKHTLLKSILNLAKVELAMNNLDEAIKHAKTALLMSEETDQLRPLYETHQVLASAYKASGQFEKTVFHLESYHRIERQIFNEDNLSKTRHLSIKFELEKAHHDAEVYRLKSQMEEEAHDEAKRLVRERTKDLEEAQVEIVTRLAVAAEFRDDDTGEHTKRVGRTAALIAYVLGWDIDQVQLLYTAARLHDVGKIGISDTILLKPGKFTDEEFAIMKNHTTIGAKILANGHSPLLKLAEAIAQNHHEKYDGRGYPNKISGEAIPLAARIVSVADVLDALTSLRPYKKAWTLEETLAEIQRNSGTQFDPQVVEVCMLLFGSEGMFSPQDAVSDWEHLYTEMGNIVHLREPRVILDQIQDVALVM